MISQQALGPFLFGFNYVVPQFWMIALHRSGALAHDRYVLFRLCMTDMLDRQIHFVCVWQVCTFVCVHERNVLFMCMTDVYAWQICTYFVCMIGLHSCVHGRCALILGMADAHYFCTWQMHTFLCVWQMHTFLHAWQMHTFLYTWQIYTFFNAWLMQTLMCVHDRYTLLFVWMADVHSFVCMTLMHSFVCVLYDGYMISLFSAPKTDIIGFLLQYIPWC